MGPLLLVDKSFIQMLNAAEVAELRMWFDVVTPPTLFREIIGDLRKAPDRTQRQPAAVLRELASKLQSLHGATPANFRKLALANLAGHPVSMIGQVPVDSSALNVHSSPDGQMLLVDSTAEQNVMRRWASGNYSEADQVVAKTWRDGLERVDLKAVGRNWKHFVAGYIGQASDIAGIIVRVDRLLNMPLLDLQARLVAILLAFLRASTAYATRFAVVNSVDPRVTLPRLAPYSASVLRLYLVFISALALELISLRPSNYVDLQYLFYVPFSMAFASNDRLHAQLFPATSGESMRADAEALKADLAQRILWREGMSDDNWASHRAEYGIYPIEMPGSVINEVWARKIMPREHAYRARGQRPKTVDDIPGLRELAARMKKIEEDSRAKKSAHAAEWPLGPQPGSDRPSP